jgi:hypothetical protein
VNISATEAALEALQARYAAGTTLSSHSRKTIVEAHIDDTQSRGFAEFTVAQATDLRARYCADLDRLAEMPSVHLVDAETRRSG